MNDELVQEVLNRLDKIGEIGADLANQGFEILLRQVYIDAVMRIIWVLVLVVPLVVLLRCIKNLGYLGGERIWCKGTYGDPEMAAFFSGLGIFVTSALMGILAHQAIARFLNPEFYVIQWILKSAS